MIVRILGEGQWRVEDGAVADLNRLDDAVEDAVATDDEAELAGALHALLEEVRTLGTPVADDELSDSELILPAADSTLDDIRALLSSTDEGLIPN
jgi:PspAA-like protein